MDEKDALQTLINIFGEIKKTDDDISDVVKKLKIVLLNLRIESARIKENNGIVPIVEELGRNINRIDESIKNLTENNRVELINSIKIVSDYINKGVD